MPISSSTRPPITRGFVLGPTADCQLAMYTLDRDRADGPTRTVLYVALRGEAQVTAEVLDAWAAWLLDRAAELRAVEGRGISLLDQQAPARSFQTLDCAR